jgi:nitrous oxidase accessory protein NosD
MSAGTGFAAIQAEGEDSYLWGNDVTGDPGVSPDDGIVVFGNNPRIVNNSIDGCAFDGIIVGAYTTGMVAYNTVTGCDIGITPSGTGIKVQRNDASGNCLGIVIDDPGGFVRNNVAHNNCASGIVLLQAGVTVRDNRTNGNADYGIDGPAGTIDLGGNIATGNGVGQCLTVACIAPPPPD